MNTTNSRGFNGSVNGAPASDSHLTPWNWFAVTATTTVVVVLVLVAVLPSCYLERAFTRRSAAVIEIEQSTDNTEASL